MNDEATSNPTTTSSAPEFSADRLGRGLASNVLTQALNILQATALVPLYLHAWGASVYGRWLTITAMVTYLGLLDLGGQGYIGNAMATAFARRDEQEFEKLFNRGFSLYLSLAALAISVVGFISILAPLPGWTVTERAVAFVMALGLLHTVPMGLLSSLWRATGHYPRGNVIGNACRGAGLLLFAAALAIGAPMLPYAILNLAISLGTTVVGTLDILKLVPTLGRYRYSFSNAVRGLPLLGHSVWFWILGIAQALNLQGLLMVVADRESRESVAQFSTHRTLAGFIGLGATILLPAIWTEFTFLLARNEAQRANDVLLKTVRVSALSGSCLAVVVWMMAPLLYSRWTGKHLPLDSRLMSAMAIQAVLQAAWAPIAWPLMAFNRHRLLAVLSVLNGAATVALAYALLGRGLPIYWATVASLSADAVFGFIAYPFVTGKALNLNPVRLFSAILRSWLSVVPLLALSWLLSKSRLPMEVTAAIFLLGFGILLLPMIELAVGRGTLSHMRTILNSNGSAAARRGGNES